MRYSVVPRCLAITLIFVGSYCRAEEGIQLRTEMKSGLIALTPQSKSELLANVKVQTDKTLIITPPEEVTAILSSLNACSTVLEGWHKDQYLTEWHNEESDVRIVATLILNQGASFRSGSWPLVTSKALPESQTGVTVLPPKAQELLSEAKKHDIPVGVFEIRGIPGAPITDQDVTKDGGHVSDDDVVEGVSSYISLALARLYDWLRDTPSACYSPEQLTFIGARFKDTFGSDT